MESSVGWNPFHGCTKISPGCAHCYVYRQDARYQTGTESHIVRKTNAFSLPIMKKRDGSYRIPPHSVVYTCFTSDFLLKDADPFREDCWQMIHERKDCLFLFFTKRIDRLKECIPDDWGDGYDNVMIGCTAEDQKRADERLPLFLSLPIKHRAIIVAPMLEKIDLSPYLSSAIEEVSVGGESGPDARVCDFSWVLSVREQCVKAQVPFFFHQTGAFFLKNGKLYRIPRAHQHEQARKAGIDFGERHFPLPVLDTETPDGTAAQDGIQLTFDQMK